MVAWYNAVTINTVASYQFFLASYGGSDFGVTANRLLERATGRSITGAASAAFASTAPTCPCSRPATPTLRQRRTDTSPTQNTGSGAPTPPKGSVAIVDPTPVTVTRSADGHRHPADHYCSDQPEAALRPQPEAADRERPEADH